MSALFVFFTVWVVASILQSAIRRIVRHFPQRKAKAAAPAVAPAPAVPTVSKSLAVLEALQAQRDLINEQIRDIDEQLDYCPPAKLRNRYLNRKTTLLGKLATCEGKISRLCGA